MNNLSNHKGYVTNLKKSGLNKVDMIDYIAGIYNNTATRNDCIAFTLRYISPKQPEKIVNERDFRKMLKNSSDKVVRELFFIAKERYNHVSRYRSDKIDEFDKTLSMLNKKSKNDLKKENLENHEIGTFGSNSDTFSDISSDVVNKLGDLENHLRDLISNDDINLNQDQLDAISQLENIELENLEQVLESISTISDNKTKILLLTANMYFNNMKKS